MFEAFDLIDKPCKHVQNGKNGKCESSAEVVTQSVTAKVGQNGKS